MDKFVQLQYESNKNKKLNKKENIKKTPQVSSSSKKRKFNDEYLKYGFIAYEDARLFFTFCS